MSQPEAVGARGARRETQRAQCESPRLAPQIPGERAALSGWGNVGDRAPEPGDPIPPWQMSLSRCCSALSRVVLATSAQTAQLQTLGSELSVS